MRKGFALVFVLAMALAAAASAQPMMQPVTVSAEFNVRPGMEAAFMDTLKKDFQPVFHKLMGEGAILAWGVDTPLFHEPGAPNFGVWLAAPDMGAFDKIFPAIEEVHHKIAARAAEMKKKGQKPGPSIDAMVDLSKHRDWVFRTLVIGFGSSPMTGVLPYTWINTTRVLPGKGPEYRQLWEKYTKPVLDKLAKEGAILAYGLDVQEVRSTDAFTHMQWVSIPNLAAREKARSAFNAATEARSEAERAEITKSFLAVIDAPASRAFVMRALMFEASAPPK